MDERIKQREKINFESNHNSKDGPTPRSQFQRLQTRAARRETNSGTYTPGSLLIVTLGWGTIDEPTSWDSKVMVCKSSNNQTPQYLHSLFSRNSECTSLDLRSTATYLRVPMSSTQSGQNCFSYHGTKLWNNLARKA